MNSTLQSSEDVQQYDTFAPAPYNQQDNNVFAVSYSGESSNEGPYDVNHAPEISIHQQQYSGPAHQLPLENPTVSCSINNLIQNQNKPIHPNFFYYRPPNDFYHYHVKCKETSYSTIKDLLNKLLNNKGHNVQLNENECMFFYQQQYNNIFYEITCEVVLPSSITDHLNKTVHGNSIIQNIEEERLVFTFEQKENIELHLVRYLSHYFLN